MYGDLDNDQLQTINEKQEQLRKLKELATKRAIFLIGSNVDDTSCESTQNKDWLESERSWPTSQSGLSS